MKRTEPILNPTLSDIIDMLQRIIIYYADPDSLGAFAKVSLDRRRKDSIQNGSALLYCYRNNIPEEGIEDVYDTTYENKNGSYIDCEIIIWGDPNKKEVKFKTIEDVYPPDSILIFIPKEYLDPNNMNKYPYIRHLEKQFYGEWINFISNIYEYFYYSDYEYGETVQTIYLMRKLFVALGFIKSAYTVNINNDNIFWPYTPVYKGMEDYGYYKAVMWTINNSAIAWSNNSASENINKLLDGFDSYDVDYWADLIETIEEAKAFDENNDNSDIDVDEIAEESDISCNE